MPSIGAQGIRPGMAGNVSEAGIWGILLELRHNRDLNPVTLRVGKVSTVGWLANVLRPTNLLKAMTAGPLHASIRSRRRRVERRVRVNVEGNRQVQFAQQG